MPPVMNRCSQDPFKKFLCCLRSCCLCRGDRSVTLPAVCAENSVCHQDGLCHGRRDAAFLRRKLQHVVPSDSRHILLAPVRLVNSTCKRLISLAINQRAVLRQWQLRQAWSERKDACRYLNIWDAVVGICLPKRFRFSEERGDDEHTERGRQLLRQEQVAQLPDSMTDTAYSYLICSSNGTHTGCYAGSTATRPAGGRVPGAVGLG